ncbi:PREDICTED: tastin [Galeopterus variegatus]|uniref:Tastin n=1 Tax=Galeopterus variegatus TaxID=482537 RepID=A0ABM0RL70_GALVR|nr:PREDICTED: tastin [Galeopterus variegatus]
MTSLQPPKDPLLRGVSPTPSRIPIRSQRRPPLPTEKPCALDQENQDPRRLVQKTPPSIQRPFVDSAGTRAKGSRETKKSQRSVGITQLRNPLEELRPSPGGQNMGAGPPPQTEAPGAVEFVADPAALATILSGEGVKSCRLGCRPSLAQRVLVRGSQGGTIRRGQDARASAYLPPRIPSSGSSFHPSTRPSFQELRRETGGNSRTSASQASGLLLETPGQPASSVPEGEREVVIHSDEGGRVPLGLAQRVPLRETREITHTRDSHGSHLMPSPAPLAQPMPGHMVPPSVTRPSPFGQARRVPSPGSSALTPYSVLRRLANRPKTRFTPIPSAPRVQQAQWLSGLSPQSCPEEPALPWEQIAVRLFDQENCIRLKEGPEKPPVTTPSGPHPDRTPKLQGLRMQRISILQQLLKQEVEGLAGGQCVPLNGGSSLDMVELQPLLTEISRTLNAPEHKSGTSHSPRLLLHSGLPKPCLPEEYGEPQPCSLAEPETPESCSRSEPEIPEPSPEEQPEVPEPCPPAEPEPPESCSRSEPEIPELSRQEQPEVPEPCPPAEPGLPESCSRSEPEIPEPSPQEQPEVPEPCPPAEPGPLQSSLQGQARPPEPYPRVEPEASEACSMEARSSESSPQPCCSQWAPATTSLIFSSQSPLCASPPIRSLQSPRPPTGQAGPSSLAPRTLALRQRLKACLTAIHCFHEARLDDECAFYTSRTPPSGPTRVCTNPVATLLEWQDALCFIPVGSAAPQGSPS